MKTPARLHNYEAQEVLFMVEARLNAVHMLFDCDDMELTPSIREKKQTLIELQNKLWAQLHGTEATDVEGI